MYIQIHSLYCVGPHKVRLVKDSSPSPSNTSAVSQSNVSTTSTSTSENTSQKGTSMYVCMYIVCTCVYIRIRGVLIIGSSNISAADMLNRKLVQHTQGDDINTDYNT